MLDKKQVKDLEIFAAEIRLETFKEFATLGFGHIGGAMSIIETLAVLYGRVMKVDPKNPSWMERDFFALSKGHAGPALYATLALKGYFPMEKLATLNKENTMLPSHCSRVHTPGVDLTTGCLGQGISTAIGAAHGSRILKGENYAYCIIGDGECNEGQIWEGALYASHHKLDNLVMFVDNNKLQLDGSVASICELGDLAEKFKAFNWFTQKVDGHGVDVIYDAVMNAKAQKGRPSVIILDTVKGKGCLPAEATTFNHHMMFPDKEENKKETTRLEEIVAKLKVERGAI